VIPGSDIVFGVLDDLIPYNNFGKMARPSLTANLNDTMGYDRNIYNMMRME